MEELSTIKRTYSDKRWRWGPP